MEPLQAATEPTGVPVWYNTVQPGISHSRDLLEPFLEARIPPVITVMAPGESKIVCENPSTLRPFNQTLGNARRGHHVGTGKTGGKILQLLCYSRMTVHIPMDRLR